MALPMFFVSAGDLSEYCFPQGSLGSLPSPERMWQGTAVHKKLQNIYAEDESMTYKREVPLKKVFSFFDFELTLHGRADGIYTQKNTVTVHEIKSTFQDEKTISEPLKAAHKAQMMIYACIYALEKDLPSIACRLSYFCIASNGIVNFDYLFETEQLQKAIEQMILEYAALIRQRMQGWTALSETAKELAFPYPSFRIGQREAAAQVYSAIKTNQTLFLQAPTGAGKTLSALFPAIKYQASECKQIFCLSAKNQTKLVTEKTLELLRQKGLKIKSCTITAKSKACLMEHTVCDPEVCPYSLDFYQKLHKAMPEILQNDSFTQKSIREFAQKYELCPYELSLEIAMECHAILADYNYVFDPFVHLKRFFDSDETYLLLIDEAHNLVDRSRDMYSSVLSKSDLRRAKALLPKDSLAYKRMGRLLTEINRLLKEQGEALKKDDLNGIIVKVFSVNEAMEPGSDPFVTDTLHEANRFCLLLEYYTEENFCLYTAKDEIRLSCQDASAMVQETLKKGAANILYSATLSPYEFYKNNFMPEDTAYGFAAPYPFDPQKLLILADYSIDTRYNMRDDYYPIIGRKLDLCRLAVKGNFLVFFPSYRFMETVYEYTDHKDAILMQKSESNEAEREEFLSRFENETGLTGFAVTGSHFAEGLDFPNLEGIVIVGVSLPQVNTEREKMRQIYQEKYQKGFEYAFVYPGINKVCQAAGRLIRKESDSGFLVLMDRRFQNYKSLLPEYWSIHSIQSDEAFVNTLKNFDHER